MKGTEMKKNKIVIALAVIATTLSATTATAAIKVSFTPAKNIPQKGAVVSFKLAGLPKTHGIYIEECMTPASAQTPPTVCDSNQSAQAWASNLKADIAQGASDASKPVTLKPDPYWAKGDCVHAKCEFVIVSDHNAPNDTSRSEEHTSELQSH